MTSVKTAVRTLSALEQFSHELTELFQVAGWEPAIGSIASMERTTFPRPELVDHAQSCGVLSLESAFDHLVAYLRACAEPAATLSPWTCIRGLLEVSAVSIWLLDPDIDAVARVSRHFAFRYEGFDQQRKLLAELKDPTRLAQLEKRVDKVECDAVSLGFVKLVDKNGKRYGIAQAWPGITELIGQMLAPEGKTDYRLLSAVAHGHHWALHQVGYKINRGGGRLLAEKHVQPDSVVWTSMVGMRALALSLCNLWRIYGWDWAALTSQLETTYDEIGYNTQIRFWRSFTQ